ncbi:hypothetical protein CNMCM7691_003792 [Aspergillus felis]|uniref:Uncharacterized protein n=1 Tax=Aspergillus felis TaxID=1287682 RepID=A0A8H6R2W6_9EURO|nr:hypothetical protein CNMCM7691_003792 [Aspergillus felis]
MSSGFPIKYNINLPHCQPATVELPVTDFPAPEKDSSCHSTPIPILRDTGIAYVKQPGVNYFVGHFNLELLVKPLDALVSREHVKALVKPFHLAAEHEKSRAAVTQPALPVRRFKATQRSMRLMRDTFGIRYWSSDGSSHQSQYIVEFDPV